MSHGHCLRGMRGIIFGLCLLLCTLPLKSQQSQDPAELPEFCKTDEVHQSRMETDRGYREDFLRHTMEMEALLKSHDLQHKSQPPQYTIPIVVHIIHLGEAIGVGSNISDNQVHAAVDGLNDRFSNAIGMGLDMEIEFCLATRDPEGCPTTGILRVDGSDVPDYAADGIEYDNCGADESDIKDLSRWPVSEYYNIWVVHDICGNYAGYAYYPNGGPYDGTVIIASAMTYNSRTLAHEVGHGFDLRHTFNGDNNGDDCPPNSNCMSQGDLICDTPPHKRGDCGSTNPCMGGGVWENSRYNYMSYCGTPVNLGRFTNDQKTRMRAAAVSFPRSLLLNSEGCGIPIQNEIISSDEPMCPGEQRELQGLPDDGEFEVAGGPGDISGNTLTALSDGIIVLHFTSCVGTLEQEILVYPNPDPIITSTDEPMCVEEIRELTAVPEGGFFSILGGPGLLDENSLTATGSGIIDIGYFAEENGCAGETMISIDVYNNPEPYFENDNSEMCIGDTRVLIASPPGGEFVLISGPGSLNGDVLTAEDAGMIVVEYLLTENGCTGSEEYEVEAVAVLQPVITTDDTPICFDESRELTAEPPGGFFGIVSGPGIIEEGYLKALDFGTIIVVYTYSPGNCEGTDTLIVPFLQEISPALSVLDSILCPGEMTPVIVSPDSGVLTLLDGPGILSENILSPTAPGVIELEYRTCAGVAMLSVLSNAIPAPHILTGNDPMCVGDSRDLQASLPGGTFSVLSGPGILNENILVANDTGNITIEYAVTENTCTGFTQWTVEVFNAESPQIELDDHILTAMGGEGLLQWVDCENQYEPIPGENSDVFVVTTTGSYGVIATHGVCRDTSDCLQVTITLTQGTATEGVWVAPNPSHGMLKILGESHTTDFSVRIIDMMGRSVYQSRFNAFPASMDLRMMPAGLYMIEIRYGDSLRIEKVLLQ